MQGQAEQLPHRILRLAARQLPSALRTQYSEDWEAELDHILKRHDALPITRLVKGFRFATSLFLRGARRLRADHMSQPRCSGTHVARGAARARRSRLLVVRVVGICLSGQCVQVTTSGARCGNRVLFPHTRCHMHKKVSTYSIPHSQKNNLRDSSNHLEPPAKCPHVFACPPLSRCSGRARLIDQGVL